jgi:hypothetical protein
MDSKNRLLILVLAVLVSGTLPGILSAQDRPDTASVSGQREVPLQFQVGLNAYNEGKLREAYRRLTRATRSDTADPRARYWLGKTLFEMGRNDSAVRVLHNAEPATGYNRWYERELANHRARYDRPTPSFPDEWSYVGLIDGKRYGAQRHITPSGLAKAPKGGWYSVSFEQGRLTHFSEEGKVLTNREGLTTPSDVLSHPEIGLLVSELREDRIRVLTDDNGFDTFAREGIDAPSKLLEVERSLFVFNSSTQSIVQLAENGDTVGTVWEAPRGVNARDVSTGPESRFWILDDVNNQFIVVNRRGERVERHDFDRNLDLRSIWWRRGRLVSVGQSGVLVLDSEDHTPTYLSAQGDTLPGDDVSDVLFRGDRMIVSAFESSQMLMYRPPETPEPDMIVRERRMDFSDFPIVRMNVLLNDPLESNRFEYLSDKDFGLSVENRDMLPSLLRRSGDVYSRHWILVVDNRLRNERAWEELRPFLEQVIGEAPEGSRGSIWRSQAESVVAQSFTKFRTPLENALNRLNLYEPVPSDTNVLGTVLNRAYDTLFSLKGPGGVIVFSNHLNEEQGALKQIAQRSLNSGYPLVTVSPSPDTLGPDHPLTDRLTVQNLNFGNLETNKVWSEYKDSLRHHYTTIYRSNLGFQPSSLWRNYELRFYYFDRIQRHNSGFLFP